MRSARSSALSGDSEGAPGQRVAVFYTKVHDRLLRPLLAANAPPAPAELRHALATIDRHVRCYIDEARLGNAA
jgi:hypothetical protein